MNKKLSENTKERTYLSLQATLVSFFTQRFPRIIICSLLFIGGIVILFLRIPGWSLILGLPATQIGVILLIFSFDEVSRKKLSPNNLKIIPCKICNEPILASSDEKEKICSVCREKIKAKVGNKKS